MPQPDESFVNHLPQSAREGCLEFRRLAQPYTPTGQLFRQWGVNIYPQQYQYNEAGRATSLKTFRTKPGDVAWSSDTWPNPPGGDTTQWIYDNVSELLARKVYADNSAVVLTYDTGNFVDTKANARNQVLNLSFDLAGQWTGTTYTDGTPNVSVTYDRAGRKRTIMDGSGTRTLTWAARDQPEDEIYTAGGTRHLVTGSKSVELTEERNWTAHTQE